jgi:uncharacterized protein HemX
MGMSMHIELFEALTEAGIRPEAARKVERQVELAISAGQDSLRAEVFGAVATKADFAELKAATKADFAELKAATKADIDGLRTATKADIDGLRAATKADFAELKAATKADIDGLRTATKADVAELKADLHKTINVQMWRMVVFVVSATAFAQGLFKFLID